MKNLTTVIVCCLILFAVKAEAQKTQNNAMKFSSQYTNLNRDCKTFEGKNGTDDASDCRGIGGYRVNVSAAAAAVFITAQTPVEKDSILLASQDLSFSQTKTKIEWRMSGGKPFAVIMRVAKYGETDEENPYFGKKTGEELIVRGLKNYEDIDFKVDAKTPNANLKARELADNAYLEKANKK